MLTIKTRNKIPTSNAKFLPLKLSDLSHQPALDAKNGKWFNS